MNLTWYTLPAATATLAARRPAVDVRVTRFGWAAVGGPDQAEGVAVGEARRIWELPSFLGYYIEAANAAGTAQWWGKLWRVEIECQGLRCTASLDELYNKVRVAYTDAVTGTSTRTSWSSNTASIALYGTWEKQFAQRNMVAAEASARVTRLLADYGLPRALYAFAGRGGPATARLYFRGLWGTLAGLTYTAAITNDSYQPTSIVVGDKNRIGDANANAKVEQQFAVTTGRNYHIKSLEVQLQKVATPADSVRVAIYSDNAGSPNALLESVDIPAAAITGQLDWVTCTLAGSQVYASGTAYHILACREPYPGIDAANYYFIATDEECGYTAGDLQLYDHLAGTWGPRGTDADMVFRLRLEWDTAIALADVVEECGQFLAGTDAGPLSSGLTGVLTAPYTTGDKDGLTIAQGYIEDGVSSGNRLLPWITRERYLRIEEQPDPPAQATAAPLRVRADGVITTRFGFPVDWPAQVVRRWAFVEAAEPLTRLGQYVQSSGFVLIEAAELDVATGLVRLTKADPWQYLELQHGRQANRVADQLAPLL